MSVLLKSVPLMIAGALASGALAACGGSGANASAGTSQRNEQQILNFTRCMREHGVNITTSDGSGGGPVKVTGTTPQVMEAAQKACARYRPQGAPEKLSPAERARREDQVHEFARCMREHGVEVQAQTGNGDLKIGISANNVNPESPAFQAAQKACESYLPKPPGGRAGGPRPGAGGGQSQESSGKAPSSGGGYSLGLNGGK